MIFAVTTFDDQQGFGCNLSLRLQAAYQSKVSTYMHLATFLFNMKEQPGRSLKSSE